MESTAEIARDILEVKHRNTDNSTSDWSEVMVVEMKLWTYQICKLECVSRATSINSPILNGVVLGGWPFFSRVEFFIP